MNANKNAPVRERIIELGKASIETKGGGTNTGETMGKPVGSAIADE